MKKFFLISILFGVLPLSLAAQTDDLYFVPKKKAKKEVKSTVENVFPEQETYYSGSNRTVEEYNRLESKYEVLDGDSTMSDVIDFSAEKGVYPDSLQTEDFEITKKLQRFDDYDIADNAAFWAGYERGRYDWAWHSPWYYRTYGWYGGWYDPWYYGTGWYYSGWYGWYDPWYDPWYYGWYSPWYYSWHSPYYYGYAGYYGWYYPRYYYVGGGHHYAYNGVTGTQRHGRIHFNGSRGVSNGRYTTHKSGVFGGPGLARVSSDRSRFGTSGTRSGRLDARSSSGSGGRITNSSGTFGGNRRNSGSYSSNGTFTGSSSRSSGSYSSGVSRSSSSGGSFGGSRSSGGTIGGSRSSGGGGGSFGGRRR